MEQIRTGGLVYRRVESLRFEDLFCFVSCYDSDSDDRHTLEWEKSLYL